MCRSEISVSVCRHYCKIVWKRDTVYPRGGVRTDTTTKITNGYAAEKVISKVVSDGEWKPYPYYITNSARLQYLREKNI